MSDIIRVGVVGLSMGSKHLQAAIDNGAEISAICDIDVERMNKVGDEKGIPQDKRFVDWKDLLKIDEMDAVIIATPDQLHEEMGVKFLNAGKHVMCEKPLALTREELERIIAATRKSDKKFMVGQITRFTPAFVKAKELIEEGKIGELFYVESEYAHDYAYMYDVNPISWRLDPKRHGVIGGGCHAVDLLRWIAGDPEEVFAYGSHKLLPMVSYDDATISVLKFPNGVCGKVFVSTGCKMTYTMRTLFYGTKGTIICDNTSDHMKVYTVPEGKILIDEHPEIIPIDINNHNAVKEFQVFKEVIDTDAQEYMDAVNGARTVEACLAIVESSKTGKPVRPNYKF